MRSSRYMKASPEQEGGLAGFVMVPTGLGTSAARLKVSPATLGLERRLRSFAHLAHQPVGPIKRPEFYQPFPLQFNPRLDAARKHVVEWSRQMGIVHNIGGMCIWDEPELEEYDFALCAAGCQPDVSGALLDLTTDWFTWATYADDYFPLVYARGRDLAGAKVYVAGLDAFMPLDCGATPPGRDPVERGLADLWFRTASPLPASARPKFRSLVQGMLQSWVWELVNHIENRIPDPVDYIEMRRQTFGAEFGMSLAQLNLDPEIPPEIFQTRTLRALINSAADAVGLINDIVSFRKEIEIEGELNNCVLVVKQFLDCPAQQAIDIVRDISASRIRQFEHVQATELPALLDQFKLKSQARESLLHYIWTITNWVAGVAHWHFVVPRYINLRVHPHPVAGARVPGSRLGLGTAGARLQPPRELTQSAPVPPGERPLSVPVSQFTGLGAAGARLEPRGEAKEAEPAHAALAPVAPMLQKSPGLGTAATRLVAQLRAERDPVPTP